MLWAIAASMLDTPASGIFWWMAYSKDFLVHYFWSPCLNLASWPTSSLLNTLLIDLLLPSSFLKGLFQHSVKLIALFWKRSIAICFLISTLPSFDVAYCSWAMHLPTSLDSQWNGGNRFCWGDMQIPKVAGSVSAAMFSILSFMQAGVQMVGAVSIIWG